MTISMNFLGFTIELSSKVKTDVGEPNGERLERNPHLHEVIDTYNKKRVSRLTYANKIKNTGNLSQAETLRRYRTAADPSVFCFGDTPRKTKLIKNFKVSKVRCEDENRTERSCISGKRKRGLFGIKKEPYG